jgi:hypothetical protein
MKGGTGCDVAGTQRASAAGAVESRYMRLRDLSLGALRMQHILFREPPARPLVIRAQPSRPYSHQQKCHIRLLTMLRLLLPDY